MYLHTSQLCQQASQLRYAIHREIIRLERTAERRPIAIDSAIQRLHRARKASVMIENGENITQEMLNDLVSVNIQEINNFLLNNSAFIRRTYPGLRVEFEHY